jgi:Kef-type K+ transport system membrane component KefB
VQHQVGERPIRGGPLALASVGAALIIVPGAAFESFATTSPEIAIIRSLGVVLVVFGGGLTWAVRRGGGVGRRSLRWLAVGTAMVVWYTITSAQLFLFTGFSVLFTGALDLWLTRAHIASEELRNSLMKRPPPDR